MRPGRGNILRVRLAVAAKSARGIHALFKAYETAIRAALATVVRTPRIVLGLGACSNADDADANSQHEQQEPHSRLLVPPNINAYLSALFPAPIKRDGSQPTWRSCRSLVRSAIDSANARPVDQFCSMVVVSIHSRGPRVRLAQ